MPEDRRADRLADTHARPSEPARRAFLRYSGAVAAAGGVAGALTRAGVQGPPRSRLAGAAAPGAPAAQLTAAYSAAAAAPPAGLAATPIRPPAAPLAVRSPYLSTWLPATTLPGTWQQFWTGHVTA